MNNVANPSGRPLRDRLIFHAGMLGAVALLASTALTVGNRYTAPAIAQRYADDMRASLKQVIPANLHDNDMLKNIIDVTDDAGHTRHVYLATRAGHITAVAFQAVGEGYGGPIHLMLGIARDGTILGVRVISHSETPGLGDRIELSKTHWILGFNGLSLANTPAPQWHVKKDGGRFDQFSGATITPRAVVKAVHAGLEFYRHHRGQILKAADTARNRGTHS